MEQIYQDRDQFAKLVREVAAPDVGRMGIEILSFTIKVSWGQNNIKHKETSWLVAQTQPTCSTADK